MALYAVGDLQGCLSPLTTLLDHVGFDPLHDRLWLTGDLVNRGPDSIGCLAFVKNLGSAAQTVLGNHDLHLLALHQLGQPSKDKNIAATLDHPDAPELLAWLAHQPMLIQDTERQLTMTHAGIPPLWSDKKAAKLAQELEQVLAKPKTRQVFLANMYGNDPRLWKNSLDGMERLRYIVNAFTRMRFCDDQAKLEFNSKSAIDTAPAGMRPWFAWPAEKRKHRIVFGHWAALMGRTGDPQMIALDTGYVWGNHMTLMNLDTQVRFCCDNEGLVSQFDELAFAVKSAKL